MNQNNINYGKMKKIFILLTIIYYVYFIPFNFKFKYPDINWQLKMPQLLQK